jgi:chromosome segregation ATPase
VIGATSALSNLKSCTARDSESTSYQNEIADLKSTLAGKTQEIERMSKEISDLKVKMSEMTTDLVKKEARYNKLFSESERILGAYEPVIYKLLMDIYQATNDPKSPFRAHPHPKRVSHKWDGDMTCSWFWTD